MFIQHGDTRCVLKITLRIEAVRRTMSGYLAVVLVTTGAGTLLLLVLGSLHTQTIWLTRATSPIKLLIFFLGLYKSCNCFSSDAKAGCSIQVTIVFSSVHLFSIFNIKAPLISLE